MNTIPNATCNPCIPSYPSQGFLLFLLRPFIPPPRRLVACFLIPLHLIWYTFIHACDKASSIRKYCVRMRASQSREIGRWTILPDEFAWDRVLRMQIFRIYAMEIAGLKEERRIRIIQFAI